jgi:hypothetical protein
MPKRYARDRSGKQQAHPRSSRRKPGKVRCKAAAKVQIDSKISSFTLSFHRDNYILT